MFSMVDFLGSYGAIEYNDDNMTMECPSCHKAKNHFLVSINPDKPVFNCFRCGYKGGWAKLIVKLKGIGFDEANELVKDSHSYKKREKKNESLTPIPLPPFSPFTTEAIEYLNKRGINDSDIEQYGMYYCSTGEFFNRIIIPIYYNNRQITFLGRAISKSFIRYRGPKGSPLGRLLFNYDAIPKKTEKMVLVEGIFDAIRLARLGWPVVATFGKKISEFQIDLIRNKNPHEVVIYWDSDASKEIKSAFLMLQKHFNTSMALIEEGDPDTYSNPELPIQYSINNLDDFYEFQMQAFSSKINSLDKAAHF